MRDWGGTRGRRREKALGSERCGDGRAITSTRPARCLQPTPLLVPGEAIRLGLAVYVARVAGARGLSRAHGRSREVVPAREKRAGLCGGGFRDLLRGDSREGVASPAKNRMPVARRRVPSRGLIPVPTRPSSERSATLPAAKTVAAAPAATLNSQLPSLAVLVHLV